MTTLVPSFAADERFEAMINEQDGRGRGATIGGPTSWSRARFELYPKFSGKFAAFFINAGGNIDYCSASRGA